MVGEKMIKRKSFTLIEILVVVFIIALMATLVTISVEAARKRSRDARRISDLTSVAAALQLYYADYHHYPVHNALPGADAKQKYMAMVGELWTAGYINNCPQDPNATLGIRPTPTSCQNYTEMSDSSDVGYRYSSEPATGAFYFMKTKVEDVSQATYAPDRDYIIKNGEPTSNPS